MPIVQNCFNDHFVHFHTLRAQSLHFSELCDFLLLFKFRAIFHPSIQMYNRILQNKMQDFDKILLKFAKRPMLDPYTFE